MSGLGQSLLGSCEFSSPPKKKLKLFKPSQFSSRSRRWEHGKSEEVVQEEEEIRYSPDQSATKEIIIRNYPDDDELVFDETRIFLPDELVTEILEWLPVKSVIGFRCVSKLWCALFRNLNFIRNHRHKQDRAKCATGPMLLLRRCLPPRRTTHQRLSRGRANLVDVLSFHDFDSPERKVRPSLRVSDYVNHLEEGPIGKTNTLRLLGPINGIICMKYVSQQYILCNPVLREYRLVPPLLCDSPDNNYRPRFEADGFGLDLEEDDDNNFKIIVMHRFLHRGFLKPLPFVYAHLYTSKTNSWRQLGDAPVIPATPHPLSSVFFNGACHWCGTNYAADNKVILSFNMTYEAFLLLELPECLQKTDGSYPHPVVLNNCLGIVQYYTIHGMLVPFTIWVMKEYGVKESWAKQFVISQQPCGTTLLPWKNDTMLLLQQWRRPQQRRTRGRDDVSDLSSIDQLTSIDLHTGKMGNIQVFGAASTLCGLIYKESLVTLN